METSPRILIVSNSAHFSFAHPRLEERGFSVVISRDCEAAFEELLESSFDLVVADSGAAESSVEFIKRVRATPQLAGILILVTAEWGTGEPTLALAAGADAFEPNEDRPINPSRLITSIERLLGREAAATN
jgi:DNA-binding response OmpR family regulator